MRIEFREVSVQAGNYWTAASYPGDGNYLVRNVSGGMPGYSHMLAIIKAGAVNTLFIPDETLNQSSSGQSGIDVHRLFDQLAILTGKERA